MKKKCPNCEEIKPLDKFSRDLRRKDKLSCYCKSCRVKKQQVYYIKNKVRIKLKAKENYQNKKDYYSEYRAKVKDHVKSYHSDWAKKNKAKCREYCASYRANKLSQTPTWLSHSQKETISQFYKYAVYLSSETGISFEVDHIIPLKGKDCRGLHVPWNLQILTKSENSSKKNS